jgi:hypothetical protein
MFKKGIIYSQKDESNRWIWKWEGRRDILHPAAPSWQRPQSRTRIKYSILRRRVSTRFWSRPNSTIVNKEKSTMHANVTGHLYSFVLASWHVCRSGNHWAWPRVTRNINTTDMRRHLEKYNPCYCWESRYQRPNHEDDVLRNAYQSTTQQNIRKIKS